MSEAWGEQVENIGASRLLGAGQRHALHARVRRHATAGKSAHVDAAIGSPDGQKCSAACAVMLDVLRGSPGRAGTSAEDAAGESAMRLAM